MADVGRPPAKLDWEEIGKLLIAGCKAVDIAPQFGLAARTLYDRCQQDLGKSFSEFTQEKRTKGDNLLRQAQFKNAMEGNTSMQIWLGKQRLGQREKFEESNNDKKIVFEVNYSNDTNNPVKISPKELSAPDNSSSQPGD